MWSCAQATFLPHLFALSQTRSHPSKQSPPGGNGASGGARQGLALKVGRKKSRAPRGPRERKTWRVGRRAGLPRERAQRRRDEFWRQSALRSSSSSSPHAHDGPPSPLDAKAKEQVVQVEARYQVFDQEARKGTTSIRRFPLILHHVGSHSKCSISQEPGKADPARKARGYQAGAEAL